MNRLILLTRNNVQEISNNQLCVGCGTCIAVCPTDCISIHVNKRGNYEAFVDGKRCTACKLCLKVCPSNLIDFNTMNISIFGKPPSDILIGNYQRLYLGYAKDSHIRNMGQSGGLITALLAFAIDKGLIDGAVVTRMTRKDLSPEVIVAENKDELLDAAGSKYCYAPVNTAIKKILKKPGKYAVVELPCQMYGLRKLEDLLPQLNGKVFLHIGTFCSHAMSLAAIDFLSQRAKIQREDIDTFNYRTKKLRGWPGDVLFNLKNGRTKYLPREYRVVSKQFFVPWRCRMCSDYLNEFSDIAFGDAWLPSVLKRKKGETIVISRTKKGDDLIRNAKEEGIIEVRELSRWEFLKAQKRSILKKKQALGISLFVARMFGNSIPIYSSTNPKSNKITLFQKCGQFISSKMPFFRVTNYFLKNLPFPLLRFYAKLVDFNLINR